MHRLLIIVLTVLSLGANRSFAQDNPAYRIFDSEGKEVSYAQALKASNKADVVFLGELHNNPICHWLQLELTQDLYQSRKDKLVLGAEMFEADNQLIMDEYLSGKIRPNSFLDEARLWPNYETDYAPLVEFAKEHGLRFIATNIPRRYAKLVFYHGLEGLEDLSDEAKAYLPPLPITVDMTLPAYASMLEMGGGHGGENLPKAQAVKDATMAHWIVQNRAEDQLFVHYNGAFHSDNYEGTVWYVKQQKPDWKVVTFSTVMQADLSKLDKESKGKADFIICVPENMTSTH